MGSYRCYGPNQLFIYSTIENTDSFYPRMVDRKNDHSVTIIGISHNNYRIGCDNIVRRLSHVTKTLAHVTLVDSHPIKVTQNLLCRFVIMQDSNINTAIDNRRVYHLVAYFFFLNVRLIFSHSAADANNIFRMYLLDLVHSS